MIRRLETPAPEKDVDVNDVDRDDGCVFTRDLNVGVGTVTGFGRWEDALRRTVVVLFPTSNDDSREWLAEAVRDCD